MACPPSCPRPVPSAAAASESSPDCADCYAPAMTRDAPPGILRQVGRYPTIALVLQGGGALGSYQCGVYEGMHDAGIRPNWFAGISIGAINAAILAGNAAEDRVAQLRAFWEHIVEPGGALSMPAMAIRSAVAAFPDETDLLSWARGMSAFGTMMQGQRGF